MENKQGSRQASKQSGPHCTSEYIDQWVKWWKRMKGWRDGRLKWRHAQINAWISRWLKTKKYGNSKHPQLFQPNRLMTADNFGWWATSGPDRWVDIQPVWCYARTKICPFVRNRVDGARVHGSDQKLQVGSDRLKMTVEVVSRGHKHMKMKCFETRHSCGKLIVLDNQITIEVVTK